MKVKLTAVYEMGGQPKTEIIEVDNKLQNHPNLTEVLANMLNAAVYDVEELPIVRDKRVGWIGIEEEMPHIHEEVVALTDNEDMRYEILYLDKRSHWYMSRNSQPYPFHVTHWMPIPQLPETIKSE